MKLSQYILEKSIKFHKNLSSGETRCSVGSARTEGHDMTWHDEASSLLSPLADTPIYIIYIYMRHAQLPRFRSFTAHHRLLWHWIHAFRSVNFQWLEMIPVSLRYFHQAALTAIYIWASRWVDMPLISWDVIACNVSVNHVTNYMWHPFKTRKPQKLWRVILHSFTELHMKTVKLRSQILWRSLLSLSLYVIKLSGVCSFLNCGW
jgi:hypothetical protein